MAEELDGEQKQSDSCCLWTCQLFGAVAETVAAAGRRAWKLRSGGDLGDCEPNTTASCLGALGKACCCLLIV